MRPRLTDLMSLIATCALFTCAGLGCQTQDTFTSEEDADTQAPSDAREEDGSDDEDVFASDARDPWCLDTEDTHVEDTGGEETSDHCIYSVGDRRCTNGREQACHSSCERWDVVHNCSPNELPGDRRKRDIRGVRPHRNHLRIRPCHPGLPMSDMYAVGHTVQRRYRLERARPKRYPQPELRCEPVLELVQLDQE